MRHLFFFWSLFFVCPAFAQEGEEPVVNSRVTFCGVEDIYHCTDLWSSYNGPLIEMSKTIEDAILGTCSEGTCTSEAPNQQDIDLASHPVSCSLDGSEEVEPTNNTARSVIYFSEIVQPYPAGSNPRSGRKGHIELGTSVHCLDLYDCVSTCQLAQGAFEPYSIDDFECHREEIGRQVPISERVWDLTKDLCVADFYDE